MKFENFLVKDTSGKKSLTASVFVYGSVVVFLKLILSGITIAGVTLAPFTGGEFAAALGALGGVYVLRRANAKTTEESDKDN